MSDPQSATSRAPEEPDLLRPRPLATPAGLPPSHALQVVDTTQTVLTALALAFIFRAFLVEAFIIPTGSMAQSLLGAHVTRTCPACGWEFDHAPGAESLCPNCHLRSPVPATETVEKAGDRILVHKWPFVLGGACGARRWEVIVFRNPADPSENYIKRLIGLPGETVEIVDGDVFIDGRIARKTAAAQRSLWFIVFDQNYYPHSESDAAPPPRWVRWPATANATQGWMGLDTRVLECRNLEGGEQSIRFDPADERYFQDVYAYGRGPSRSDPPSIIDLRVLAELTLAGGEGTCRWELARDTCRFVVEIRRDGVVSLWQVQRHREGREQLLAQARLPPFQEQRPYTIEFAHLDYRVYLRIDGREVVSTTEDQYAPDLDALRRTARTQPTRVRIGVTGLELALRGLRLERDVYYTYREGFTRRAYAGRPFALSADEYFVLGDNSPDSRDSREWDERSPNLPADYRLGTVRSDQIIGPAAFVYLPGLLHLDGGGRLPLPDLGRMRFVR